MGLRNLGSYRKGKAKNLIGHCGFNILKENSEVEIVYLLARESWGKGYANVVNKSGMKSEGMKEFFGIKFLYFSADISIRPRGSLTSLVIF